MKTSFKDDPDWRRIDPIDDISGREFALAVVGALSLVGVVSAAIYYMWTLVS